MLLLAQGLCVRITMKQASVATAAPAMAPPTKRSMYTMVLSVDWAGCGVAVGAAVGVGTGVTVGLGWEPGTSLSDGLRNTYNHIAAQTTKA